MRKEIDKYWKEREVKQLLHFTRIQNLPSIARNGLVPRAQLELGVAKGVTNDCQRLDRRKGYNCLSISFPNGPMFYRFQRDNPADEWAIVAITPKILPTHDILFCWRNAASGDIANASNDHLSTLSAFQGMFGEREGQTGRAKQKLRNCDPTNVQAEVLVRGVIAPQHFLGVYLPNQKAVDTYRPLIGGMRIKISTRRGLYGTRDFYLNNLKG
ncbi:DarT ssDNA thymidine ADP-ribosyltransferase family protein [Qipengyuania flava]|uniref:DarT ssDNA thymidine ADP-ribosyltransferase family protein n=1 Tax=Qipengyuania flava TaxID=192812 RepID=UPI00273DF360|nr:DarT ssDNA thymidine ADP-ribosyltransferase family protein [Qipengyuania flava]